MSKQETVPEIENQVQQTPQSIESGRQALIDGGIIPDKTDFDEFLNSAPVIQVSESVSGDNNPAASESDTGKQGENEYLVRADATKQDAQAQQGQPNDNAQPDVKTPENGAQGPGLIKVGDVEMSPEEWLTAKKYYDNYEKWNSRLNRESEMVKHFTDEQLKLVVPYASKQKPLPENLAEEALKAPGLPKEITVTDEDGDQVKIKTSQLPKELIESLAREAFVKAYPEIEQSQVQYNEMKQKYDELAGKFEEMNNNYATHMTVSFMKEHPDVAISIRKGETFSDVFQQVISNPMHPEYQNALRFKLLIDNMRDTGSSLEDSYRLIFGKQNREKEIQEKIIRNQQTDVQPINSQIPVQSADDKALAELKDPRVSRANQLFGR